MILIADAGATKTDWRVIERGEILQFKSDGFNPRSHSISTFVNSIPREIISRKNKIKNVYYYGAALSDPAITSRLKGLLLAEFKHAEIFITTDLFGAARSLFGKEAGVACILGTGSAACFYDGFKITKRIPSLGYILGDEGSGFYLGKELLSRYLRGQLSEIIENKFNQEFGKISEEMVLHRIYQEPKANAYLAGFTSFVINNQSDPFLYQLAYRNIELFFQQYFRDFEEIKTKKIRFTGSVAYFLSNIIRKFATDHQLTIDLISQSPIAGLTLYHKENG